MLHEFIIIRGNHMLLISLIKQLISGKLSNENVPIECDTKDKYICGNFIQLIQFILMIIYKKRSLFSSYDDHVVENTFEIRNLLMLFINTVT